jgi:hypothetical protein
VATAAVVAATLGLAAASWVVAVRRMDGMDLGVATAHGSFAEHSQWHPRIRTNSARFEATAPSMTVDTREAALLTSRVGRRVSCLWLAVLLAFPLHAFPAV